MYITLNNIEGEKTIDLSHSIIKHKSIEQLEIAVVSLFSDNIQYEFKKPLMFELPDGGVKLISSGSYSRQELIDNLEGKIEIKKFDSHKKNALRDITEIVICLNEIDNTDNLSTQSKSRSSPVAEPSLTLLTYQVTPSETNYTNFLPNFPQYKKLKNEEFINSLNLKITHKRGSLKVVGPPTTLVLHVK